ncbi:potassium voltage-gated channel subfamily H member 6 isoform X7 [Bombus vosnesenskii]|uniref:Potassium voltage-gated channel subfamily H member 6 isoform X7 n=4 Tax=Bombus TaxID=28641 RepID=A0A6J3LML8_9HYME|nr:potassium voltage-gated channel subfamily H member 6 isoform X7 [Bombus impatiens]XP_033187409.1 potassium voltage-gated channel subfamily H member 6 isoform X7 [Bombus vancouverensis nearcticus]XP_033304604.1 potassium voltage-gated channel subfamily H member 6 isoform X7 [Bombus bifarius]XP_033366728.1 potassium voltage-gated channel subfamily H member 6 isoform X7 [Bombus vosnesenskii]XP_048268047.1 potassium voltage-gated channel subfamily H member 6 isoform X9 [Bombus terrestris]XP_050
MPVRRGHVAPRTTIIETIIRKFDTHDRSFLVANAQQGLCHIIYCSDGFCRLTGFSRAEVMQRPAICDFLHGPMTSPHAVAALRDALAAGVEKHFEILYYRKDGTKFLCSEVIALIRSEVDDICLQIINFEDLSSQPPPQPAIPPPSQTNNRLVTRFDRARASFRAGLSRTGVVGPPRVRNRPRTTTNLPHRLADGTILDEDASENCPLTCGSPTMMESWGPGRTGTPPPALPPPPTGSNNGGATSAATANVAQPSTTAPIASPEGVSDVSQKSGIWEGANFSSAGGAEGPSRSVSHAASLDAISRRAVKPETTRAPCRSLTCSVLAGRGSEHVTLERRPATVDNLTEATKHSKIFPGVASESDLQKWRTKDRKSPSLSQIGPDSIKHKFSLQDNGSAKYFQGAMHTSNMGEKVAQVLSLGNDILPEYKLQSPRIGKWTILHYSPFKAVWDWVILLLVLYTAIFTPYVAAFVLSDPDYNSRKNKKYSDDPIVIIDFIVDVTFIVDIIINFRTTFVNSNDEVVSHPAKIAVHYLKGWFIIDLVAAIPFDLFLVGSHTDELGLDKDETTTLIGLLKTARLLRLVRVARKIDRYSEYGAAVLLLLMGTFALSAHWMACIWYAIGNAERPTLKSKVGWLDILANDTHQFYFHNNTGGPSIRSRYITALYFTFSSLTSVGFGNVAPNTDAEKIFTIIVMLIGSLMYASIFGNVSAIIQRLYSGTARYHTQMLRVREFIKFHQIPNPLRQRLEEYFQHAWTYTNGIDMNSVLKGFPECLQADICLHLNRNLLNNCRAFEGASPGCLRALSLKFKTTHAPPGDTLVHRGDVLTSLYFISRGSIEILKGDVVMAILAKDDIFGENPCIYPTVGKASCNVRALTYCDLHKIHRDDLLDVLALYPEFSNHFSQNLEITFNLRDEEQAGVDPISARFPVSTPTDVDVDARRFAFRPPRYRRGPGGPGTNLIPTGRQDSLQGDQEDYDKGSGHGILEFSTDKAGQDVTPLNLEFDEPKQRSSTLNSITGMLTHLKRSIPDLRQHKIHLQPLTSHDYLAKQSDFQSGPGRPVEEINARIDQLSRQVTSLEHSMGEDIRLILNLLQQTLNSSRESSSIEMMPGTTSAGLSKSSRAPALVQRSASEPQPPTGPPSNNGNGKLQPSTSHSLFSFLSKSLDQLHLISTSFILERLDKFRSRPPTKEPASTSSGTSRLTVTSDSSALATALQTALRTAPTRSQSQPVDLAVPPPTQQAHLPHGWHSQPAAFRRGEFRSGYSSFNKRSEPEGDDPWSCVVSVSDRGSSQRPRSSESRKEPTNHRGSTDLASSQRSDGRQLTREDGIGQASGQRQESSRQTSEDISWEFTINEAPIARLESLDELDQDHGS